MSTPAGSGTELRLVWVVAVREVTTKLRDRTFLLSFAFFASVLALALAAPLLGDDDGQQTLAVPRGTPAAEVAQQAQAAGAVARQREQKQERIEDATAVAQKLPGLISNSGGVAGLDLTLRYVDSEAAAVDAVRAGEVDAALVVGQPTQGAQGTQSTQSTRLTLVSRSGADPALATLVSSVLLAQELTDADRARIDLTTTALQEQLLEPPSAHSLEAFLLSVAFAALFFLTNYLFGYSLAQTVAEEKQNRVVEILVATVAIRTLLTGKVLGGTALALGQLAVLLTVGLAVAAGTGQRVVVDLLLQSGGWFALFFVVGFVMLACLWSAAGALSARVEDLQSTTLPVQILVLIPWITSVTVTDPGRLLTALSYVPFTSPLAMPRRIMIGDASWWEPLLALALILLTAVALIGIATRLYQGGLLRTATRSSLLEAWRRS